MNSNNKQTFDIREMFGSSFDFNGSAPQVHSDPATPAPEEELDVDRNRAQPPYGILILGAVLIAWSLFGMQGVPPADQGIGAEEIDATEQIFEDGVALAGRYPNPKLTFYERYFCRGNQTADWCRTLERHFYHPKVEALEDSGWTYDDYLTHHNRQMPPMKRNPTAELKLNRFLNSLQP